MISISSNKFWIGECVDKKINVGETHVYEGDMVSLFSHDDHNFKLIFPIREKDAKILRMILEYEEVAEENQEMLGLFITMIDSWKSSDKMLGGSSLDSYYDPEIKNEVFIANFFLTNKDGYIESMVKSNFSQILILSALEEAPVFISDTLLKKLIGSISDEKPALLKNLEDTEGIIKIAQEIMKPSPKFVRKKSTPPKTSKKPPKKNGGEVN